MIISPCCRWLLYPILYDPVWFGPRPGTTPWKPLLRSDYSPDSLHSVVKYALSLYVDPRLSSVRDDEEDGDDDNDDTDAGTDSAAYYHSDVSLTATRLVYNSHALTVWARVCLSHAGIVSKRLNVGSRKQHHVIAQGL